MSKYLYVNAGKYGGDSPPMDSYKIILLVIACIFVFIKIISSWCKRTYTEKARRLDRTEAERRADYAKRSAELDEKERSLSSMEQELNRRSEQQKQFADVLSSRESQINAEVRKRFADTVKNLAGRDYLASTPVFQMLKNKPDTSRLVSALSQNMKLSPPFDISSRILSESGEIYHVTLHSCSCKDFTIHRQPCKHMYRLAAEVGALLSFDTSELSTRLQTLLWQVQSAEARVSNAKKAQAALEHERAAARKLMDETKQSYPWLASLYADLIYVEEGKMEQDMREKRNPAKSSADKLKVIRDEKRQLQFQCKALEYQLHFYETLFPWLEDFKELPPIEAYQACNTVNGNAACSEYDYLKNWLSPSEYHQLPAAQRLQLALDRYQRRKKSNWDVGIEYERYIGYLCEQRGFRVEYSGAALRLEDMGRDLIVSKGYTCYIIQCKRWSQEKTIHEKHIFQLFGSCVLFELQNSRYSSVSGVFVSTTTLSPVAHQCADRLGIQVLENIPCGDFPVIKCNISNTDEKIYHLPFDQQYDRVVISPEKGEFFAFTVDEAENAGFRHAFRHRQQ